MIATATTATTAAAATTAKKAITSFLTAPSRVAHALDWKKASGALLSLRVCDGRIDLAAASHPSFPGEPILPLPSIPIATETVNNRHVIKASVARELKGIVDRFNIAGIVVSWPVQKEGWCGASCGKTLHVLDQVAEVLSNCSSSYQQRPICLYDPEHHVPPEDEWGRAPRYGVPAPPGKTLHVASKEQYACPTTTTSANNGDSSKHVAVDILNDFYREHWPEFANTHHHSSTRSSNSVECNNKSSNIDEDLLDDYSWDDEYTRQVAF
jgi:hypothetical protein